MLRVKYGYWDQVKGHMYSTGLVQSYVPYAPNNSVVAVIVDDTDKMLRAAEIDKCEAIGWRKEIASI